jgi:hypothetical protein
MTWFQFAIGVFVGEAAWAVARRIGATLLVIRDRRTSVPQRWIEESERADQPVREAFRRGQG